MISIQRAQDDLDALRNDALVSVAIRIALTDHQKRKVDFDGVEELLELIELHPDYMLKARDVLDAIAPTNISWYREGDDWVGRNAPQDNLYVVSPHMADYFNLDIVQLNSGYRRSLLACESVQAAKLAAQYSKELNFYMASHAGRVLMLVRGRAPSLINSVSGNLVG